MQQQPLSRTGPKVQARGGHAALQEERGFAFADFSLMPHDSMLSAQDASKNLQDQDDLEAMAPATSVARRVHLIHACM